VSGDSGKDEIYGGPGNDVIYGNRYEDTIRGGVGNDLIDGGDGDDTITGSAGNDFLVGGDGSDRIVGSAGHDVLVAGDPAYRFTRDALWAVLADWMAGRVDDNGTDDDVLDETVIADEDLDMLTGSSGADWFIISQGDKITDFKTLNKDGDLITVV